VDGDKKADTVPAVDVSTITRQVKSVCSKFTTCIDTFVIYLNGPTTKNGDLLLWDWNGDGKASNSEILSIAELILPLKDCNAKNVLIIADQNYAGHLIDHVDRGRDTGNYKNVHVITATNRGSYSWGRDFTKMFIKLDNDMIDKGYVETPNARRISSIAEVSRKFVLFKMSKRRPTHYPKSV